MGHLSDRQCAVVQQWPAAAAAATCACAASSLLAVNVKSGNKSVWLLLEQQQQLEQLAVEGFCAASVTTASVIAASISAA